MSQPSIAAPSAPTSAASPRLASIDALRGFDMFWILGGDALAQALHKMKDSAPTRLLAQQLDHKDWEGFAFYDLIFPLFVFIAGVSIVFSISKSLAEHGRAATIKKVLLRGLLLYVVGLFYYGGFSNIWPNVRIVGVLQRIAICYTVAGLLFCLFKPKTLGVITAALLFGYWGIMANVPIRDVSLSSADLKKVAAETGVTNTAQIYLSATNFVKGQYGPGHNVADHLDFQFLPGRKHDGAYDPEGLLSTMPAIGTCLLGLFAGLLIRKPEIMPKKKVVLLLGLGAASVVLGFLWGHWFPVIKKIWTSSYVLVAGGYSAMLLGTFYLIIDVWNKKTWAQPFIWIGANALALYLLENLVNVGRIASRFVGGPIKRFMDNQVAAGSGEILVVITMLTIIFIIARFLYVRKIFLKL